MAGQTLYDKLWSSHLVKEREDGTALIYIDLQYLHEVTSPQAFEGLRLAGRRPWRSASNLATPDHNVPTTRDERSHGVEGILDPVSTRPGIGVSDGRTPWFWARCRSRWSISVMASMASAMGAARIPTQGSWRPVVTTSAGAPCISMVWPGMRRLEVGLRAI